MLLRVPPQPSDFKRWFPPRAELPGGLAPSTEWTPGTRERRAAARQEAFERFCLDCVRTVDKHDKSNPRKPLELYGTMQYLRVPIYGLMRYRRVYWCKSRKVCATILLSLYSTWLCHDPEGNELAGWVTQKKEDGVEIVESYIKEGYIDSFEPWLKARYRYAKTKGNLVVESYDGKRIGSKHIAYPAGADQLRQNAHSLVIIDEAHTFTDLQSVIQGATPGLHARRGVEGGQLVLVFPARRGAYVEKYIGTQGREAIRLANERLSAAA